jgi:hypothetical protein
MINQTPSHSGAGVPQDGRECLQAHRCIMGRSVTRTVVAAPVALKTSFGLPAHACRNHHLDQTEIGRLTSHEPAGDHTRYGQRHADDPTNHIQFRLMLLISV